MENQQPLAQVVLQVQVEQLVVMALQGFLELLGLRAHQELKVLPVF